MADVVCGPSTALQQFQKHSSTDRTVQQDRQVATISQTEGFRTTSNINAGILDPEFEAFNAGPPHPLQNSLELRSWEVAPPFSSPVASGGHESVAAWANDFQRLGLSDGQQSDLRASASENLSDTAAWQQDFLLQQEHASLQQSWQDSGQSQSGGYGGTWEASQQLQGAQPAVAQLPDEADFEQAFSSARLELQKQEMAMRSQLSPATSGLNVLSHPVIDPFAPILNPPVTNPFMEIQTQEAPVERGVRIGSDTIEDNEESEMQEQEDVKNELARTAAQFLDSVKDDHSQKFRNSSFLELMRRIRDREVVVRGNNMVEEISTSEDNAVLI
ncbi:MAG: hypothetical protein M1816_008130 [Peltula sp. TS41687]|nr:MAG: hypothetical protein M1816_008130 [Peltula sp. TS41687]